MFYVQHIDNGGWDCRLTLRLDYTIFVILTDYEKTWNIE